jgi:hypothetical protein
VGIVPSIRSAGLVRIQPCFNMRLYGIETLAMLEGALVPPEASTLSTM